MVEQKGQVIDVINDAFSGSVDSGGHFDKRDEERMGWVNIDQSWTAS
jgi:hypothetical protein